MPTRTAKSLPPRSSVTLPHRLHALLHTVRTIAHFEDELCTLLHAAEHAETLSPELSKELTTVLGNMPKDDYLDELEAVRSSIDMPARRRPRTAKKVSSKAKTAARKPARAKPATPRSKAAARPKARKAKS